MSERKLILGCVALVVVMPFAAQAQQRPTQVPAAQLSEWLSNGATFAGVNAGNGCVFLITGPAGERTQFYSCPNGTSETAKGVQVVEDNMLCGTWSYAPLKQCREWHHVGEAKFELKEKGQSRTTHTIYRLK
jgi:hypothetical protein